MVLELKLSFKPENPCTSHKTPLKTPGEFFDGRLSRILLPGCELGRVLLEIILKIFLTCDVTSDVTLNTGSSLRMREHPSISKQEDGRHLCSFRKMGK